jgi:hypothetical protein
VKSLESGLSDAQRQLKRALDVTDMYQQKDEQKGIELLKMQQNLVRNSSRPKQLNCLSNLDIRIK